MLPPSAWRTSASEWGYLPQVPDAFMKSPLYPDYVTLVENVKLAAEKVIAARRKDNLGGTADEAAVLLALKEVRRRTMKAMKEKVAAIAAFRPDPYHVQPTQRTPRLRCGVRCVQRCVPLFRLRAVPVQ